MKAKSIAKGCLRAIRCAAMLACGTLPYHAAQASTYQPAGIDLGATTFYDAFGSTDPGWATIQLLQYENNDKFYTNTGDPNGLFKNGQSQSLVWLPQIIYTSPFKLLGGALGFTVLQPVVYLNAHDDANSFVPLTSNTGVNAGDTTFGPFWQFAPVIAGGRPVFVQRFEFDVIAPTGAYDPTKLVNQGSNFWSINPYWSMTFLPTPKTEVSMRLHYLYNFTNGNPGVNNSDGFPGPVDSFRAGQAVWVNFAASYKVLPSVAVGLNGFWFRQLSDDHVNGQPMAGSRTTNLSLGPGAMWTINPKNVVFANIYLPVVERNTFSGFHMNLRWIHAF
ncbi:hypothetical protein C7401_127114 [Paraburkholderia unamae]|uniref:SphA family protein n=1 Tax=Paraburkholderia unamae TaxID=219649 RepID=UPI000DC24720|nr:transporter [Paraburkholderia unamae]RAR53648.1 hypothetical protein C7401_127114 [Paraburkholderia unamae]